MLCSAESLFEQEDLPNESACGANVCRRVVPKLTVAALHCYRPRREAAPAKRDLRPCPVLQFCCMLGVSLLWSLREIEFKARRWGIERLEREPVMRIGCLLVAGLMTTAVPGAAARAQESGPYNVIKIQLTGGEGGWDYITADPDGRHLFVARSGD